MADMAEKWRKFNIEEVELLRRHNLSSRAMIVMIGGVVLTTLDLFFALVLVLVLKQTTVGMWFFVAMIPCFAVLVVAAFVWLAFKNKEDVMTDEQLELYAIYRAWEWRQQARVTDDLRWQAREKWHGNQHFYTMVAQRGASDELLKYLAIEEDWENPLENRP